jgi:hypothetical protein
MVNSLVQLSHITEQKKRPSCRRSPWLFGWLPENERKPERMANEHMMIFYHIYIYHIYIYISYLYLYIYISYLYIYTSYIYIYHIYINISYLYIIYIYICTYLYIFGGDDMRHTYVRGSLTLLSLTKRAEKMLGDDVIPSTWWFNHLTCHYNETTWWDWKVNMVVLYMCFIGFDFDRDHSGIMMEYIIMIIIYK